MMWWALQTVVVTAAMAALILLLGRWNRVTPAALHVLWILVLVRFVVPPVLEWPWPLTALIASPDYASPTDAGPVPFLRLIGETIGTAAPPQPLAAATATPANTNWFVHPTLSAAEWSLLLWAIAAAVVFALQIIRLVRVQRMLQHATPPPAWMQEDVNTLSARIAVSPPTVELSPHLPVPVYWNLGRPRLLVPSRLINTFDHDAWNAIFLHELAHHKRRDHWVGWLELIAGCVWWWNPVFWFARRRMREQAELACDAWVIGEFPERRRAYADALLRVFESVSQNAGRRLAWSMAADIRLGFERRLKMIYASPMPRTASAAWSACGLALLVLVTPSWSLQGDIEPPSTVDAQSDADIAEEPSIETRLDAMVDFEFQNEHIAYICDFLADYAGVNIALDYRVIDPGVVTTPIAVEAQGAGSPGQPTAESRKRQPAIPNPEYVTDGMVPYIRINNATLREALGALCRPLNLRYETTPGFIWISSPRNLESETWPLPTKGTGAKFEEVVSSSRISIEFEDESIFAIAAFMAEYLDLNIMVDNRVIAPGNSVVGTRSDIVTTGIVPKIKMSDASVHEALAAMLRPLNLAYRLEDSFIWISSPEKLRNESFRDMPRKAEPAPQDTDAPIGPAPGGHAEEDAAPVSVLRIIRWSDGSPRAEIKTEKSRGFYGVGEAFEQFEIRSIDSEKKTVEVFDAIENEVETLSAKQ